MQADNTSRVKYVQAYSSSVRATCHVLVIAYHNAASLHVRPRASETEPIEKLLFMTCEFNGWSNKRANLAVSSRPIAYQPCPLYRLQSEYACVHAWCRNRIERVRWRRRLAAVRASCEQYSTRPTLPTSSWCRYECTLCTRQPRMVTSKLFRSALQAIIGFYTASCRNLAFLSMSSANFRRNFAATFVERYWKCTKTLFTRIPILQNTPTFYWILNI